MGMDISLIDNVLVRSSRHGDASDEIWCIPSAVNSGRSFVPMLDALREARFLVRTIDFPGYGASPAHPDVRCIDALASIALHCIRRSSGQRRIVLVGHSLGSAVAVRVATKLGDLALGVFSIEGNLTGEDGYLSGLAADYAVPEDYKAAVAMRLVALLPPGADRQRALEDFQSCDARTIWNIGRSARDEGADDGFGREFLGLRVPALYYWGRGSATRASIHFMVRHGIANVEYRGSGHWPMKDIPIQLAADVHSFASSLSSR
jgi:pimeloyl-ACP methyl ester carboxylesterase